MAETWEQEEAEYEEVQRCWHEENQEYITKMQREQAEWQQWEDERKRQAALIADGKCWRCESTNNELTGEGWGGSGYDWRGRYVEIEVAEVRCNDCGATWEES